MRINLLTPFAEKDAAKALGARWDSAKKVWYIDGAADLTPFLRWIPNMDAAVEGSTGSSAQPTKNATKASSQPLKGKTTKSKIEVPHCGCNVQPWEDCEHTAKL